MVVVRVRFMERREILWSPYHRDGPQSVAFSGNLLHVTAVLDVILGSRGDGEMRRPRE